MYILTLTALVLTFLLFGVILTNKSEQKIVSVFELNNQGDCIFESDAYQTKNSSGNYNSINHYQLLAGSRFSFLGCWLLLQPIVGNTGFNADYSQAKKRVFIYRDSLSELDFSRLSNVITHLNDCY